MRTSRPRRAALLLCFLTPACSPAAAPLQAPLLIDVAPAVASTQAGAPPPPPIPHFVPPPILGRWEGVGVQSSGPQWSIVVEITSVAAGRCATVRYPSSACAGEWDCTEASDGTSLHARERITEGKTACIDGGEMTLALLPSGEIVWHWEGSGETADARLRRVAD